MELKDMRKNAGLNQAELATLSGVNLRSLQDYEQGHKSLASAKGETLLRLSSVLGYSVEEILTGSCMELECFKTDQETMKRRMEAYTKGMQDRKIKEVHFPVVVSDEQVDMSRIYPTKQGCVKKILDSVRGDERIVGLYLFGSSITMACNRDSDLDIAVKLKDLKNDARNDISERIQLACDWGADILWMDHLTREDRIYKDIVNGLVLI